MIRLIRRVVLTSTLLAPVSLASMAAAPPESGATCRASRYATFGQYVHGASTQRNLSKYLKRATRVSARHLGEQGTVTLRYPPGFGDEAAAGLLDDLCAAYEPAGTLLGQVPRVDLDVYVIVLRTVPESYRVELRLPTSTTQRFAGFLVLEEGRDVDRKELGAMSHELMHHWLNIDHHGNGSPERETARWFIEGMCELAQAVYLKRLSAPGLTTFERLRWDAAVAADASGVHLQPWISRQMEALTSKSAGLYEWQRQALAYIVVRHIRDEYGDAALRQITAALRGFPRTAAELDDILMSVTGSGLLDLQRSALSTTPTPERSPAELSD